MVKTKHTMDQNKPPKARYDSTCRQIDGHYYFRYDKVEPPKKEVPRKIPKNFNPYYLAH